jgi:D-alanyl-D-alanine carboxypeptidase
MEEVQRLLDQLVAPGAAAWIHDEHGSVQAASGVADLRTGRPMRPELQFRAGSLTKSLVASVVLQLVAEGRLSLSDTLERWLPAILPYGDRVTIHQLLNHTSCSTTPAACPTTGRPSNGRCMGPGRDASARGPHKRWPAWWPTSHRASRRPAWSYSNTGYVLLGLIVEAATGNTLARELGRCIFGPLGLRDTLLPGNSPGIPSPASRGYSLPLSPQGEVITGPLLDFTAQNPSWAWAAGALVSTLEDLGHFFRALLGGRLLPPRLLAEMLSTVTVPPGSIPLPLYDRYGLGLLEVETPAGRLVGNVGGIPGFLSIVLSTPDGRRQLGIMINVLVAPDSVYEAFTQVFPELGARLLSKRR